MEERGEERGAGWGRGVGCGDRYGTGDLVEGKKKEVGYKPGAKNAAGRGTDIIQARAHNKLTGETNKGQ